MEGVGDQPFRIAMGKVGGFDWACTEFIRVSMNAHIPSLCKEYTHADTGPIPQAAQIMGSEPRLMAEMARALEARGAPRIDLNCGCPSNTVTGKGAGSSLLKTPELLHQIAKGMVDAVKVPVTAKLRSGFTDISLFRENLLAAQESGIAFLTLHPRTKEDGYGPPARWDLIAEAKQILRIPLVGNGDILTPDDALRMKAQTNCDGLMIGRGAVMNPWIFHAIRARFNGESYDKPQNGLEAYLRSYIAAMDPETPTRTRINKLKQMMSFIFRASEQLLAVRSQVLSHPYANEEEVLQFALPFLH
jgi:tRNA-dihydrouridine synthase C